MQSVPYSNSPFLVVAGTGPDPGYTGAVATPGTYGLFSRAETNKTGGWYAYNNASGVQPPAGTTGGGMVNSDPNTGAGFDPTAAFEIHFQGTALQLYGFSNTLYGTAAAYIDGVLQPARISYKLGGGSVVEVFRVTGLPFGRHVFKHQGTVDETGQTLPQFYTIG